MPAYLKGALAFEGVEILSVERILSELRDFQSNRSRLIVAFRHPYGDEAQLMFHVFENMLPRLAKQSGNPLLRQPGLSSCTITPYRSGATRSFASCCRARRCRSTTSSAETNSLNIRTVLRDDPNPLGLAPEGQISYHSETLPRIELGTVRMGFGARAIWSAQAARRKCASCRSRCIINTTRAGLSQGSRDRPPPLIAVVDGFPRHREKHAASRAPASAGRNRTQASHADGAVLSRHLPLCGAGGRFGARARRRSASAAGTRCCPRRSRLRSTRSASIPGRKTSCSGCIASGSGWSRVKPEESLGTLSPLELALADRRAGEGWLPCGIWSWST